MSVDIKTDEKKTIKWYEHLASGWPLILVFVGGILGGLLGGAAYAANVKVFEQNISNTKKYVYISLIGIGSFFIYFVVSLILA